MDNLRYMFYVTQESMLNFRSDRLVASLHLVWKSSYSVFEIPFIFLRIRAMLCHPFNKRRGTLLCRILFDAGSVGYGRVCSSQWFASPQLLKSQ